MFLLTFKKEIFKTKIKMKIKIDPQIYQHRSILSFNQRNIQTISLVEVFHPDRVHKSQIFKGRLTMSNARLSN